MLTVLCAACLVWNVFPFLQLFSSSPAYVHGLDNNYYFAWARSIVVDGDLDFANDLEFVANHDGLGGTPEAVRGEMATYGRTETGLIPNRYGIGTGLLALPLVAAVRPALGLAASVTGEAADPFSRWYAAAFVASGVLWGFLGLFVCFRLLECGFGRRLASLAILLAALGLSLGHYLWFEPTMSHATGFGVLALYLLVSLRWESGIRRHLEGDDSQSSAIFLAAGCMGLLLGLAVAVRYTNVCFALVPFVMAIARGRGSSRAARGRWMRLSILSLGTAALGAFLGFLPQLIGWKVLYGSWVYYSYEGHTVYAWPRHLPHILFGSWNGLFFWTPLALAAVAGLIVRARSGDVLAVAGCAVCAAFAWIYGSWEHYNLGHSFGMRGFVECSFFFMVGFAELGRRIALRWDRRALPRRAIAAGAALLVVWNVYFLFAYRAEVQPPGEPFAGRELIRRADEVGAQILRDLKINRLAAVVRRLTSP